MVGGSRCRDSRQGGDGLHAVRSAHGCPSALGAGPLPSALQDATTVCPRDGGAASWAVPRPKGSPAARSHRRAGGARSPPPGACISRAHSCLQPRGAHTAAVCSIGAAEQPLWVWDPRPMLPLQPRRAPQITHITQVYKEHWLREAELSEKINPTTRHV